MRQARSKRLKHSLLLKFLADAEANSRRPVRLAAGGLTTHLVRMSARVPRYFMIAHFGATSRVSLELHQQLASMN